MSIPVLIISYSRISNVLMLITELHSQGVNQIYLAIDGSKNGDDRLQSEIEAGARSRAAELSMELKVWRRDTNLGPAVSVIKALDWFFSIEESGLILEDDLILSRDAIQYFENSLFLFSELENIFLVTGSNYFDNFGLKERNFYATHYPVIWGWATWSNRWKGYRTEFARLSDLCIPASLNERWFWKTGLRRCLNGIVDAWDIPLVTYQLSHKFLSIMPRVNLVSNCGADEFAGNTLVDEWPLNMPLKQMIPGDLIDSTEVVELFDQKFISEIDLLFREKVYGIRGFKSLHPTISKFFDLLRYPKSSRRGNLIERLNQVTHS